LGLRLPNRGASFARCLIAIAAAADLDARATQAREEARYLHRIDAWRTASRRGFEPRADDAQKLA
jgi:hypothetical protein